MHDSLIFGDLAAGLELQVSERDRGDTNLLLDPYIHSDGESSVCIYIIYVCI